jgi:hypothetical protein
MSRGNYSIRATHRDIDEGVQGNSFHYLVARANRYALQATDVRGQEIIIVTKAGLKETLVTPPEAGCFMESHGSALLKFQSAKPFRFTLNQAN